MIDLKKKSYEVRKRALKMIFDAKTGHTGGALSSTDILTTLFYSVMKFDVNDPQWPDRDRFILSKGHSVEPYYTILADIGFIEDKELDTFSQFGTRLIGHPNNKVPGVEMNSGALGHGLSVGTGMALAAKLDKKDYRVFVLMGDGEQAEGSNWEAAMAAGHYKLDNLWAIIDRNGLQISGNTEDVMTLEPLNKKWEAFGFHVVEVDGHEHRQIEDALKTQCQGKPTLIIANTVKGRGISYMEGIAKWHHGVPEKDMYNKAINELEEVIRTCK